MQGRWQGQGRCCYLDSLRNDCEQEVGLMSEGGRRIRAQKLMGVMGVMGDGGKEAWKTSFKK